MEKIINNIEIGQTLSNNTYRIIGILGQGGFGITYLAKDLNLDREVAIKEFFPKDFCYRDETTSQVKTGVRTNEQLVDRLKNKFLKEARTLARLNYKGIIKVHGAFEENNTAYFVMEYIKGETLSEKVKREGPLPLDRALKYISQVGDALDYIHQKRLNHLDVKPANVMIRQGQDNAVLIDFGLSKQYDSEGNQTSTTPSGISHGYAPAEQYVEGGIKEFSPRTDLYSLAATLYFALTGQVPPKAFELIDRGLDFPSFLPSHIKYSIAKAMAVSKTQRHENVRLFLNDLSNPIVISENENSEMTALLNTGASPSGGNMHPNASPISEATIYEPNSNKNKKNLLRIAVPALMVVGLIVALVLWFGKSKDDAENSNDTFNEEKANFTTADLKLLSLHGPVEKVEFSRNILDTYDNPYNLDSDGTEKFVYLAINPFENDTINFDTQGFIDSSLFSFSRNSDFGITYIYKSDEMENIKLKWEDGRPVSCRTLHHLFASNLDDDIKDDVIYDYNSDGMISHVWTGHMAIDGIGSDCDAEITYEEFDRYNNWTKCNVELEIETGFQNQEIDYLKVKHKASFTVKRSISYYQ